MTDAELVALARAGDTAAFDQLVARHQAAVFRAALAALRNREDAEDVTQDAFVRAWSALGRFRGDATFRTWMLRIVWNCAMSRRRAVLRWWRRRAQLDEALTIAASESVAEDRHDLRRHVAIAIEALSSTLRDTLLLAESGEYEYGEIAALLNVPVGTVKWRVAEARRKVRAHLAAFGYVNAR